MSSAPLESLLLRFGFEFPKTMFDELSKCVDRFLGVIARSFQS